MRTKKPLILLLILLNLLSPFIFIFNSVQAKTQEQESLEPIIQEFDEITFTNGIKLADKEADYLSIVEAKIGDTVEVYSKVEFKQQVFDFDYEIFLPNGAELKAKIDCNSIGSFQLDECSYDSKANVIKFKVGNVDIGNIIELKYQVEVTDIQSFISADKAKFLARANYKNSDNKTINYSSDTFVYIYWDSKLEVTKEVVKGYLAAGEIATVNVVVTNNGTTRTQTNVELIDYIPSNIDLVNNSISSHQVTINEEGNLFTKLNKLEPQDHFEFQYQVKTKQGVIYGMPITSKVVVNEKNKNDQEELVFNFGWKAKEALLKTSLVTIDKTGKNATTELTAKVEVVGEAPIYNVKNIFNSSNSNTTIQNLKMSIDESSVTSDLDKLLPGQELLIKADLVTSESVKDGDFTDINLKTESHNALGENIRKDGSGENPLDEDNDDASTSKTSVIVPELIEVKVNNGEEITDSLQQKVQLTNSRPEYVESLRTLLCKDGENCEQKVNNNEWQTWESFTTEQFVRQLDEDTSDGEYFICAQTKDKWNNLSEVRCDSIIYQKGEVLGEEDSNDVELSLDEGLVINPGGTDFYILPFDQIISSQHIPYGIELIVIGQTDSQVYGEIWYQVLLNDGTTGWVKGNDLQLFDNYQPQIIELDPNILNEFYICSTKKIELMFFPAWDSTLVSTLYLGTKLYYLESANNWTKVLLENGTIGWIYSTFLCEELQNPESYLEDSGNIVFKRPYIDQSTGISGEFGLHDGTFHTGTDYALDCGSDVLAAADGIVVEIATDGEIFGNESTPLTKANYIKLRHISPIGEQWETWYWHLSEVYVEVGDEIKQNDLIGKSGNTGYVRGNPEDPVEEQGCHLHFDIRWIDPNSGAAIAVDPELMLDMSGNLGANVLDPEEALEYGTGSITTGYTYEIPMQHYGQGDSRWGSRLINGVSGCSMSNSGCVVTSMSMLFNYFQILINNETINPQNMLTWLENNGALSGCLMMWEKVAKISDLISYAGSSSEPPDSIQEIIKFINQGYPIILLVKNLNCQECINNGFYYSGDHYLIANGYKAIGDIDNNGTMDFDILLENPSCINNNSQYCPNKLSQFDEYYVKYKYIYYGPVSQLNLTKPSRGEEVFLDTTKVNFEWTGLDGSNSYKLKINSNEIANITSSTKYTYPISNLSIGSQVNWSISTRAKDMSRSENYDSDPNNDIYKDFTGDSAFTIKPRPPKITRPVSNTIYPNQQVNFEVDPVLNHYGNSVDIQYRFQISNDPTFNRIVHDSGWQNNTFYANYNTPTGGQHYVRAFSRYKLVESSPSQTVSFMVMHPEINYFTYTSVDNEERIYQTVKSADQRLKLRYSVDGEFDNSSTNEIWNIQDSPTALKSNINTIYFDGKLLQVATGGTADFPSIFTRTSTNGLDWSTWNIEDIPPSDLLSDRIAGDVEMFIEYYNNQPRLYQMVTTEGQNIFIRYFTGSDWSAWKPENGMTNQDVHTYRFNNATYQVIKGKYNFSTNNDSYKNYIRKAGGITDDGYILWSPEWQESYGEVTSEVNSFEFKGKICHIARSNKLTGNIIMRCSSDGNFDGTNPSEAWVVQNDINQQTGTTLTIESLSDIGSIVFKNRIHNVMRGDGVSGNIWTRSSRDGDFSDQLDKTDETPEMRELMDVESWYQTPGFTKSDVSIATFQNRIYQSVTSETDSGAIYVRYSSDGKFDNSLPNELWMAANFATLGDPNLFTYTTPSGEERLYQAVKDKDSNAIYTRYTTDGLFNGTTPKENWYQTQGGTIGNINAIQFNGKLYQAIVSQSGSGEIYMRSSTSGDFIESNAYWIKQTGKTATDIKFTVASGLDSNGNLQTRMFQAIKGMTNGDIWMRSTADGTFDGTNTTKNQSDSFENWSLTGGSTTSNINMLSININGEQRLYQTVRGDTGNIFTRYTIDGVFDQNPINTEQWISDSGASAGDITLANFQNRLYEAIRGNSQAIWTRNSVDGVFDNKVNGYSTPNDPKEAWHEIIPSEKWRLEAGSTKTDINSIEFTGKLYQTIKGDSSETIYMRSSSDGEFNDTSETWIAQSGGSTTSITMAVFNGKLIQAMKGTSTIYMRSTSDGVFDNVDEEWKASTSTQVPSKSIEMEVFNNSLIQATTLSDGKIALRLSQDGIFNTSAEQWKVYTNQTKGNVYMEVFDNKLYLMVRGYSDDKDVYYTTITSSTLPSSLTWKQLGPEGTSTTSDVTMTVFQNSLFIGLRGGSETGNYKAADSTNIDTLAWKNDYPQAKEFPFNISWAVFNGKIYQFISDNQNNIWSRSSYTNELNFVN